MHGVRETIAVSLLWPAVRTMRWVPLGVIATLSVWVVRSGARDGGDPATIALPVATTDSDIARGWHLAYLGAVIVGFAGLAFLRDRRTLLRALVVVAAFALATVAVLQQTPPGGY